MATPLEIYRSTNATPDELRIELGSNWVIARRTPRIVKKYGADVNCISAAQYAAAQRRAIEKRKAAQ